MRKWEARYLHDMFSDSHKYGRKKYKKQKFENRAAQFCTVWRLIESISLEELHNHLLKIPVGGAEPEAPSLADELEVPDVCALSPRPE